MKSDFGIIHLCEAFASGILKVVAALANETASRGIPTVVVHGHRPETPDELRSVLDPQVRLVLVPGWEEGFGWPSPLPLVRAATVLRSELSAHRTGVLHMHSTHAGVVGRLVPSPGWKRFYTPHGYAFLNTGHPWFMRSLAVVTETVLAGRAHTIACSRAEGAEAARLQCHGRVSVVQNGLDTKALRPIAPEPEARFVVAAVGRAAYQRRPDLFAELAALLRDEVDADLVWFGDGPEGPRLREAGVRVSGWLRPEDVAAALGGTNVVVHFSAFEGLPIALLEAMTAGRAIVANDLPAIREVVGDTAVVVRTPSEAAAAVRMLRADGDRRRELGSRARDRVRRLFTKEAMVGRTLAAYGLADLTAAAAAPGTARRP
ncbi:MAG TPA: glycosyltransferase [Gaiellaceae bacterium]|jgi:glycosyltransferase involved in cell wall biosynthesis|nr:glycosyltransferase [Gaiellaceae bacterium]